MRRFAMSLIGAVFSAVPVWAEMTTLDNVTTFDLDNGMEVVVIEDHRAPVVVHMVWYRAGSADETAGVSGIAHFLEHLLFKGTDTSDYTGYFQRVAADRLELMMKMEADRMVNLRITEDDILTEREVIIEERNQRTENDPGALMREQMNAALYMNHRYGVPIIGWRHEMVNLGLEDALEFYKKFYAPNNAILVVAGDVTPEDVQDLAQQYYGPLPANPELDAARERTQGTAASGGTAHDAKRCAGCAALCEPDVPCPRA
ncbi:putative zinc protease y4wA [Nymphon striatum]|nr:putative zinc protease y4wA [Nymphon striatum]